MKHKIIRLYIGLGVLFYQLKKEVLGKSRKLRLTQVPLYLLRCIFIDLSIGVVCGIAKVEIGDNEKIIGLMKVLIYL